MNRITLLLCIVFLSSCENGEQKPPSPSPSPPPPLVEVTGKLEKLLSLPQDTVLEFYDLSGDFIMKLPDLSAYTIKSLNLSHNYIDSVIPIFFPKGIERLNLSHNYLQDFPQDCIPLEELKELNLAYNYIKEYLVSIVVDSLNISHNDLRYIALYWTYRVFFYGGQKKASMRYLNISNNPNLSNKVRFVPFMIDTIVRDNIANDEELEMIDWRLKKMRGLREAEN